jgi:hypothetical protein
MENLEYSGQKKLRKSILACIEIAFIQILSIYRKNSETIRKDFLKKS